MSLKTQIYYTLGFLFSLLISTELIAATSVKNVRVWPSPDSTRVVLDLSSPGKYKYFTLSNPARLVIDLKDTKFNAKLPNLDKKSKILEKLRKSSTNSGKDTRLVFDLTKKIEPLIFALKPTSPYGHRLVIDLLDSKSKVAKTQKKIETDRDVVVVIDAGHGGEDPGAIGPKGTYEKKITLSIAKKLAKKINSQKGMQAKLTRTGDYYISVHGRTEKARQLNADLLVSLHADAFTSPQPAGASIWVLTLRRANSEIGKWLEQTAKHSQLLGGAAEAIQNATTERYLARTLIDMSMDHSIDQGYNIADSIIGELKTVTKLHKRKPQSGNFGVLKSPDIPSILVETGFMSNPREEKLLANGWFQNKLADSIHKGIVSYFKQNPPDGTLYARLSSLTHKVTSGESLSVIAQNYKVSLSALKKANNLTSNVIRVGQTLSIPQT